MEEQVDTPHAHREHGKSTRNLRAFTVGGVVLVEAKLKKVAPDCGSDLRGGTYLEEHREALRCLG
jgi:hypothetical protein